MFVEEVESPIFLVKFLENVSVLFSSVCLVFEDMFHEFCLNITICLKHTNIISCILPLQIDSSTPPSSTWTLYAVLGWFPETEQVIRCPPLLSTSRLACFASEGNHVRLSSGQKLVTAYPTFDSTQVQVHISHLPDVMERSY